MEPAAIRILLEKYWQAETTVVEEEQLAAYFRQPEIAPDLEPVRDLFAWREEESRVRLDPGFDRRLLERIAGMEPGRATTEPGRFAIPFRFAAAAGIILSLGIGLLISVTSPRNAAPNVAVTQTEKPGPSVKDTYTDPQQALAAVKNALLLASVRINKGEHITQKNITLMHNSWQVATGD